MEKAAKGVWEVVGGVGSVKVGASCWVWGEENADDCGALSEERFGWLNAQDVLFVVLVGCIACIGVNELKLLAVTLTFGVVVPEGLSAAKELRVWSGVIARELAWLKKALLPDRAEVLGGFEASVGVDQEKAGAAVLADWARCV